MLRVQPHVYPVISDVEIFWIPDHLHLGRVTEWLKMCTWKPKVHGSSLTATYVQRWALCINHPANVQVSVKQVEKVVRS